MAKTFYVSPGRSYTVTASEGTTITYPGITKPAATVGSEGSVTFNCTGTEIVVSDNNAKIVQNFNNAGAAVAGAGGGSGSTEGVALLEGGNSFSGDQAITGDVTIDGAVTISGDVTAEGEYNGAEVIETQDTIIIPEAGKYYKYTGIGDTITVTAPVWNGYMTISYLETAEPIELQGVTWSPAKPSLTGAGPFVYTLVCAESGKVLASAMNYSVATAEAIQQVVPMAWGMDSTLAFPSSPLTRGIVLGFESSAGFYAQTIGSFSKSWTSSIAIGDFARAGYSENTAISGHNIAIGTYANAFNTASIAIGYNAHAKQTNALTIGYSTATKTKSSLTIGAEFTETTDSGNVTHTCTTEGTGSITIGAGANTLNNGDTESSNSVTIGCKARNKGADSVVIGASAKAAKSAAISIGAEASAFELESIAIGKSASANWKTVAVGAGTVTSSSSVAIGNAATTCQYGVAIGNEAKISNTTAADGTVTQSANTTVIGYGASASAPNAVVLGAGANAGTANDFAEKTVTIGAGATTLYREGIAIGYNAKSTSFYSIGLGGSTVASGNGAFALGFGAESTAVYSTAIGTYAKANDNGVVVFASYDNPSMTTKTQLYFSGANTPLANEYYNGEAMMGYTVTDIAGTVLACGTRRLSELFPDNSLTQPASLDENGEWVTPKVFHPSDLDLPIEEPTEPEDVEINIPEPEPEEYTPLPVYPIVEPEIEEPSEEL